MMPRLSLILFLLAAGLPPGCVYGAELTGRLVLTGKVKSNSPSEAVVYFEPETPAKSRGRKEALVMATRGKTFEPRVLVITRGSTVSFPNHDPILHNVFSVSPGNRFDLGFYRNGDSKSWTFEKRGLVRVFCNVHYSMQAYIVVLDTPFFAVPDGDGNFRLEGLPAGRGKLRVWHESARAWSREVRIPSPSSREVLEGDIELEVRRRRIVPHTNKHGKPYGRGGRNDYR